MANYSHPETLVTTDWVAQHKADAKVRLVEVDVDTKGYEEGHIEGALGLNWQTQLQDQVIRNLSSKAQFEKLMGNLGISNETTVITYGDNNNWFAAWFFWQLKYYGHGDVRIMNGGRKKWVEEKRPLTKEVPRVSPATYRAKDPDPSIRALRDQVLETVQKRDRHLVDVRSPDEFTGKLLAPPGLEGKEGCQRGGHIPGARNITWSKAVREDGTFKPAEELKALYEGEGIKPDRETIAYCRIGERSSHTWYVLKYLLGYPKVRNYDGSWTEWGNLINAPIER